MIRLYDTLTGSTKTLSQRRNGEVSMYVCGPTVYDHPHLGHARSALIYDVLRRYLEWRGVQVHHVANITDIDDKIIARAQREGRTENEIAEQWEAVYIEQMDALGILAPHERPHATEWVNEMVGFIEELHKAGMAYTTDSGVYLRVRKIPAYGDLINRDFDSLRAAAGSRVKIDEAKEDPLDFALWKVAKPNEPVWESPWGPGRPGWHIECTAMSLGLLGDGFDLHGGGDDLIFPHHTNERAQALAAKRAFARHWMHNAMVNVDGDKMSKSLGNFLTVTEMLEERPLNARAFRLIVLQTHYRKTMEVNADLIATARAAAERIDTMVRRATQNGISVAVNALDAPTTADSTNEHESTASRTAREAFAAAMDDDMNTPEALAVIFNTLRQANTALDTGSDEAKGLTSIVAELAEVLGITVTPTRTELQSSRSASPQDQQKTIDETKILHLIEQRDIARQMKDWTTADELRNQLAALSVVVEDTPEGSTWHYM
ncbi:MAG: cysteine--tRNA ligase [Acidimicrobiaceae bacterium]|nr:cysteine--tRNA ligase [Acidimicrobiaceae bacterium]